MRKEYIPEPAWREDACTREELVFLCTILRLHLVVDWWCAVATEQFGMWIVGCKRGIVAILDVFPSSWKVAFGYYIPIVGIWALLAWMGGCWW